MDNSERSGCGLFRAPSDFDFQLTSRQVGRADRQAAVDYSSFLGTLGIFSLQSIHLAKLSIEIKFYWEFDATVKKLENFEMQYTPKSGVVQGNKSMRLA